jgi:hypothetical protein
MTGQQRAEVSSKNKEPGRAPRMRAACTRTAGVRHLLVCELGEDKLISEAHPLAD